MEDLAIIAAQYAKRVHRETNHKYNGQPYEVHLQMVYDYACKYIHLLLLDNARKHSEVFAAAWTHDVIEDCRQTYNDVKTALGENVADIVFALTNEKGKTRKDRANDKYYAGIRGTSFATYVKICDRLANVRYSKEHGSSMLTAYRKEHEDFKRQLWSLAYQEMFDELFDLIN